ncbi:hypothetical protein V499_02308 [Pseudogymnoascus sp. VKM F-103]|uniref:DUF7702 domain-containing protein n=1 Tax=Pseudogymnoascus verrucosus TaxID=342668 RepID=A0A1B8GVU1_9PEZI|nr:uncharacterized protein VE01_01820 [Pseudogymnoascus verrucosus]KFY78564.1 hypothetical protein V499_02308 [Pseudogymnoascus sp. VKM F-103]OBT99947.1 hypothetical protein VE01_01820 [Pseudogymnoascus verrucosus]
MTPLTFRNGISIALLVLYAPLLLLGAFLSKRHGFGRSSGWIFLVIFCTLRILSGALNLAIINSPTSTSLHTAYLITNSVGLSPLLLASLGLLNRAIESIERRAHSVTITPRLIRLIQLLIMIALILAIVGSINLTDAKTDGDVHDARTLVQAAVGLFIAGYVILCLATVRVLFSISSAEAGERRLIPALAAALPFLLIRVVYAGVGAFGNDAKFNAVTGSDAIFLVMVVLMELAVVIIFEGVGITLKAIPKEDRGKVGDYMEMPLTGGLVGKFVGGRRHESRRHGSRRGESRRGQPVAETRYGA